MATSFFKPLTEMDRTSSRTLLHEAIPITGTLIGATAIGGYTTNASGRELNIKTLSKLQKRLKPPELIWLP